MELKLINVAKASLQELLCDYEDYLRTRNLERWQKDSPRFIQAKQVCFAHDDSAYYRKAIEQRNDGTIVNIAIILIYQTDYLLYKMLEKLKTEFLTEGGIREQMAKARTEYRKNHS